MQLVRHLHERKFQTGHVCCCKQISPDNVHSGPSEYKQILRNKINWKIFKLIYLRMDNKMVYNHTDP